jgi:membrane protease YdiL (CAAX protease family)
MTKYKRPLLFALCLLPIAAVAGIFVVLYQLDTLSAEAIEELIKEAGSVEIIVIVGAVQTVLYALVCGFFGYILAEKTGLLKPFKPEKEKVIVTLAISLIGGGAFSLDHWVFGALIDGIQSANIAVLTPIGFVASVLYGGIVEEVLLRLFFMSLIAFIVWKLLFGKYEKESIPSVVFVIANIVAALLFAAGHLPATYAIFGELTPLILFRCFLLNGGFGILFGWLYRKYGIIYAMSAHALFHIVSKIIWIIFI